MRARKMLYVLVGLMAAVLCVLRATTRAPAAAERIDRVININAVDHAAAPPRVAIGSLAPLAADSRHSQGDALARRLNSAGTPIRSTASPPIRGSYARLAADPRHASGNGWVARLIEPRASTNGNATSSPRRIERRQQPLATWIGWSGCSPYAARRDHLGRPTQAVPRATLSFRSPPASPRASVPVVMPAHNPLRQR